MRPFSYYFTLFAELNHQYCWSLFVHLQTSFVFYNQLPYDFLKIETFLTTNEFFVLDIILFPKTVQYKTPTRYLKNEIIISFDLLVTDKDFLPLWQSRFIKMKINEIPSIGIIQFSLLYTEAPPLPSSPHFQFHPLYWLKSSLDLN